MKRHLLLLVLFSLSSFTYSNTCPELSGEYRCTEKNNENIVNEDILGIAQIKNAENKVEYTVTSKNFGVHKYISNNSIETIDISKNKPGYTAYSITSCKEKTLKSRIELQNKEGKKIFSYVDEISKTHTGDIVRVRSDVFGEKTPSTIVCMRQ